MTGLVPVLAGARILVTAQRRADDLTAALVRRGASVTAVATLGVEPHIDEAELLRRTRLLIRQPPDIVVITTGIGLRGWMDTAQAAGLDDALLGVLGRCRVLARGPKASGALQSFGITPEWVAASETSREIRETLVDQGVDGQRIAVQLHGAGDDGLCTGLRAAGADVAELTVYRWAGPPDPDAVVRFTAELRAGAYDAVAFTSAPGASAWLDALRAGDALDSVRAQVAAGRLMLAAVGPVTAEPLSVAGLAPQFPDRGRLGSLIRLIVSKLGEEFPSVPTAKGWLRVRATAATFDHRIVALSANSLAVLRVLASQPGAVVSREDLLDVLTGDSSDPHAAEVAVARLRESLGGAGLVKAVYRRGYRLVTDQQSAGEHSA